MMVIKRQENSHRLPPLMHGLNPFWQSLCRTEMRVLTITTQPVEHMKAAVFGSTITKNGNANHLYEPGFKPVDIAKKNMSLHKPVNLLNIEHGSARSRLSPVPPRNW